MLGVAGRVNEPPKSSDNGQKQTQYKTKAQYQSPVLHRNSTLPSTVAPVSVLQTWQRGDHVLLRGEPFSETINLRELKSNNREYWLGSRCEHRALNERTNDPAIDLARFCGDALPSMPLLEKRLPNNTPNLVSGNEGYSAGTTIER